MNTNEDSLAKAREYTRWSDNSAGKATSSSYIERAAVQASLAIAHALIALAERMDQASPGVLNLHAASAALYGAAAVTDDRWEDVPDMTVVSNDPRWQDGGCRETHMDLSSGYLTIEQEDDNVVVPLPDWLRLQWRKK